MKLNIQCQDKIIQIEINKPNPLVEDLIEKGREVNLYRGHRPCFMFGGKIIQEDDFITELSKFGIVDSCTVIITHRFGSCDNNCDLSCTERQLEERKKTKDKLITLRTKLKSSEECIRCQICDKKSILGYTRLFDEKLKSKMPETVELKSGQTLSVFGIDGFKHYGGDTVLINIKTGLQACGTCWPEILKFQE